MSNILTGLTAEQITNYYLYGQITAPEDMASSSILRPAEASTSIIIDKNDYMTNGAGRFASAAHFDLIERFFESADIPARAEPYTKEEIRLHFNLDKIYITQQQWAYSDEKNDYAERVYIWNSVAFKIADTTRFVVEENGNRYLTDFAIVPYSSNGDKENFDFESDDIIAGVGNSYLKEIIDPSGIGRTVIINFSGDRTTIAHYTFDDFSHDDATKVSPNLTLVSNLKNNIDELTDKLFSAGSTRFLQDGKPIIYGTAGDNTMEGDIANYDAIDFHMADHLQLGQYVKNGIVYVAGDGNDSINATQNNDILLGGNGADTLNGNAGNDYLEGGADNDTLNGGTGFDRLNGGTGIDTYRIDTDFGNVIISGDTDGGTISLLSGVTFRKAGAGAANTNGLYVAKDESGKWLAGKEGWTVSVSGSTATVTIPDADKKAHTIVIENFDINSTNKKYGITFAESVAQASAEQANVYALADGQDWNQQQRDNLTADPFEARSITYNAADYLYHYGVVMDGDTITGPVTCSEAMTYFFDGNSQADVLNGNDWKSTQQSFFNIEDPNFYLMYSSATDITNPAGWFGDVLQGYDGDDTITGDGRTSEANDYNSFGDNDILVGGKGNDVIYGGAGNDTLYAWQDLTHYSVYLHTSDYKGLQYDAGEYASVQEALYGGAITMEEEGEQNYLDGGAGDDVMAGASYDDTIDGGSGIDYIMAGAGCDLIAGGTGNDIIYSDSFYVETSSGSITRDFIAPDVMPGEVSGQGFYSRAYFYRDGVDMDTVFDPDEDYNDLIDGGDGADTVFGEIGHDNIAGGANNDVLFGDRPFSAGYFDGIASGFQKLSSRYHGDDVIDGGTGNDKIIGGGGSDYLLGGEGNDIIYGDVGIKIFDRKASSVVPGDETDVIKASDDGWWGRDFILGGAGIDVLVGEGNNDTLDGGDGNDQLYGDWTPDQPDAFSDPAGHTGDDTLYGGAGNDQLMGNSGDDTLDGGDGDDKLFGDSYKNGGIYTGQGDDVLTGGAGNDSLYGGAGNDTLNGGTGTDYLNGGSGEDAYLFDAGGGVDVIDDISGRSTLYLPYKPANTFLDKNNAIIYLSENGSDRIQISLESLGNVEKIYANGQILNLEITVPDINQTYINNSGLQIYSAIAGTQGDDTFVFSNAYQGQFSLNGLQGNDTIQVADGWINQGYLDVSIISDRLYKSEGYWVNDHYEYITYYHTDYVLNNHANSAGTVKIVSHEWNPSEDIQLGSGSTVNLHILGNDEHNIISGKTGNDLLTGNGGNDIFLLGAGFGHDWIDDGEAAVRLDQIRLDESIAIGDLTIQLLDASGELSIGLHDASGTVTDSVRVNQALGALTDFNGDDISVGAFSLLELVNHELTNHTISLMRHATDPRGTFFAAADVLSNNFSDEEKSRWQITGATKLSGAFGTVDIDGDGDTEEAFLFLEDVWGSGINYVAFVPTENTGNASIQLTLQRDDGLTLITTMAVNVQDGALTGTSGHDLLDGGESDIALVIDALDGNDVIRDGYGNDVIHGGDGNDVLTHNWQGNGDDVLYGDAGNDTLDAGWGADTMVGGSGNDLYIEGNLWSGDHTLIDNSTASDGDVDTLQVGLEGYGMWDYRSLWFQQAGDDLLVTQLDACVPGEIRIKDWFDAANPEARLDVIRVQQDDGRIYEADVGANFDALVQAMAGFAPPTSVGAIDNLLADEYQATWTLATPMAA
jgi:Ca2+-binding RTX toxin-like protein